MKRVDIRKKVMYIIHPMPMLRTQIYFPKDLYQDLRAGAAMNNVSLAEYIRKLISEKLYIKPAVAKIPAKKGDLSLLAKNAISFGKKDLAKNFDKYFEKSL